MTSRRRGLLVIGSLPPPIHGMAAVTSRMIALFRTEYDVSVADLSPGRLARTPSYHLSKFARVVLAITRLARHATPRRSCLYMPVDAGPGMFYTMAFVALARAFGCATVLHHHAYSYVQSYRRRMAILTWLAGSAALHILLSRLMRDGFHQHYRHAVRVCYLSNALHVDAAERPPRPRRQLRLGHLGNLSRAKGLATVLELLRQLRAAGVDAQLVLAGPAPSRDAARLVDHAIVEFGAALEYRGPVLGQGKAAFFRDIDVFLFPSSYIHEAQPLVVLEALASAVPTVASACGCLRDTVLPDGGVCVPSGTDFVCHALPAIRRWTEEPGRLTLASRSARRQFDRLRAEAESTVECLFSAIADSPTSRRVRV